MKLFIKNMTGIECKSIVKEVFENLAIHIVNIEMGAVEIFDDLSDKQRVLLKNNLFLAGLELIEDRKIAIIEKIKNEIIQMVHYNDVLPSINYGTYLNQRLNLSPVYLSNLFVEVEGISIQQFVIINKIEKVKELLLYNECSLTEISNKLNYSSVGHLSNQFKKITGLSPSTFKKSNGNNRPHVLKSA